MMTEPESKKFGRGPRELSGAVDLIHYYKLLPHHEFFTKKSQSFSISETRYLHNVMGETEIWKGEGMQLSQLIHNAPFSQEMNAQIQPFDLNILTEAFSLREIAPVVLPNSEKGVATVAGKSKLESIDLEKIHKKQKDRDWVKDKEYKKQERCHRDQRKDKDNEKKIDENGNHNSGTRNLKKHHEKKKKHDGREKNINDVKRHKTRL